MTVKMITKRSGLGERIYFHRVTRQMSQSDLAQILGVEQSSVSRWETGEIIPSGLIILKLIETLNIDPKDLINSL